MYKYLNKIDGGDYISSWESKGFSKALLLHQVR